MPPLLQIYNEAVDDLLDRDNCNLRLVQSGKRDVMAEDAKWRRCESCHELLKARWAHKHNWAPFEDLGAALGRSASACG